jgi:hypothetical protein
MSETNLIKFRFGSALYGTDDESSDIDSKMVYLPDHGKLLLGHKIKNRVVRDVKPNEKMNAGEEEIEFIPLQRLAFDFFEGQSYAYELVFAFKSGAQNYRFQYDDSSAHWLNAYFTALFSEFIKELSTKFLTSDISKMVGYAAHQAQVYGVKGERLNAVERLIEELEKVENPQETRIKDVELPLTVLNGYVHYSYIKGSNEEYKDTLALQVNDRYYHQTERVSNVIGALKKLVEKYGHRAKKAQEQEVDWKALSHAIRIAYQATEILGAQKLEFPLEIADYLLAVKRGRVEFEDAVHSFEMLNTAMDKLLKTTKLPSKTPELREEFEVWLIEYLTSFYEHTK